MSGIVELFKWVASLVLAFFVTLAFLTALGVLLGSITLAQPHFELVCSGWGCIP